MVRSNLDGNSVTRILSFGRFTYLTGKEMVVLESLLNSFNNQKIDERNRKKMKMSNFLSNFNFPYWKWEFVVCSDSFSIFLVFRSNILPYQTRQ